MPDNSFDCAVLGGGPAGCSAAYHLAGMGYAVAVFEKMRVPAHVVCGEFLSEETLRSLSEMRIDCQEGPAISCLEFHARQNAFHAQLPFPGKGYSRLRLDQTLKERAEQAGAVMFLGCAVRGFTRLRGRFAVETSEGLFKARSIFLATGKHDVNGHARRFSGRSSWVGLKVHVRLRNDHARALAKKIVLYGLDGGYGGISAVEDGLANVCCIVPSSVCKALGRRWAPLVKYLRRSQRWLNTILDQSTAVTDVMSVAPIPYGYLHVPAAAHREGEEGHVYVLGDQCAVIPSWTGNGVAVALLTGKAAAHAFHDGYGATFEGDRRIGRHVRARVNRAGMVHSLLIHRAGQEIAAYMAGRLPVLADMMFRTTRMPQGADIGGDRRACPYRWYSQSNS